MGIFACLALIEALVVTIVLIFGAVMSGVMVGRYFLKHYSADEAPPVGSLVAALFALLAFLLALTYSTTSNRFEERKQLLLDEVNAIGTAYLRADFIDSNAWRTESKELLKSYVALRANVVDQEADIGFILERSEVLHKELWRIAVDAVRANRDPAHLAYATSLNDVIDLHTSRVVVALKYHIHHTVWFVLMTVSVLSMFAMGFQFGYGGGRRVMLCFVLALTFSLVLMMIEDLDRPLEGTITVDNQPLAELLKTM